MLNLAAPITQVEMIYQTSGGDCKCNLSRLYLEDDFWLTQGQFCHDPLQTNEENESKIYNMKKGKNLSEDEILMKQLGLPISFVGTQSRGIYSSKDECFMSSDDESSETSTENDEVVCNIDVVIDDQLLKEFKSSPDLVTNGAANDQNWIDGTWMNFWNKYGNSMTWNSWCHLYHDYMEPNILKDSSNTHDSEVTSHIETCVDDYNCTSGDMTSSTISDSCVNNRCVFDESGDFTDAWSNLWYDHQSGVYLKAYEHFVFWYQSTVASISDGNVKNKEQSTAENLSQQTNVVIENLNLNLQNDGQNNNQFSVSNSDNVPSEEQPKIHACYNVLIGNDKNQLGVSSEIKNETTREEQHITLHSNESDTEPQVKQMDSDDNTNSGHHNRSRNVSLKTTTSSETQNQTVRDNQRHILKSNNDDEDDRPPEEHSVRKKRPHEEEVDGENAGANTHCVLKSSGFASELKNSMFDDIQCFKMSIKFSNKRLKERYEKFKRKFHPNSSDCSKSDELPPVHNSQLSNHIEPVSQIKPSTNVEKSIETQFSRSFSRNGILTSEKMAAEGVLSPSHNNDQTNPIKKRKMPRAIKNNAELKKYWNRRYSLFSKYDEGIRLDKESWYSATPEGLAKYQASRLKCDVIIDVCCGAGGNAIQFATHCNHVVAIDIDYNKIKLAKHNAEIYGVADKIEFINGDCIDILSQLKYADVIFIDPPWGGVDVVKHDVFNLEDSNPNTVTIFEAARKITENIAIYLPRNVNSLQLISLAGPGKNVEVEKNSVNGRLLTVTAYYNSCIKSND